MTNSLNSSFLILNSPEMFQIPPTEILVETKVCKRCQLSFPITDKDLEFYDKISPIFAEKKYQIPAPTLCPDCRRQWIIAFRNECKLYKRTCGATGKEIISIYSPDKPHRIYSRTEWESDSWDPMSYGKDFDFSKKFFEQFDALYRVTPLMALFNPWSENSEYAQVANSKSCYLTHVGGWNVDVLYSNWMVKCADCMDCSRCQDTEHCYDCLYCNNQSSRLISCIYCSGCQECIACVNCKWCHNCYCSSNQTNASYIWKNEQLTKEEYDLRLKNLILNFDTLHSELDILLKTSIQPSTHNQNVESCSWELLNNCKNCFSCYELSNSEGCKYQYDNAGEGNHVYDSSFGSTAEYAYQNLSASGRKNRFSILSYPNMNESFYTAWCQNSSDLFGCVSLRNKQYCILNKQYTKEEYETLVPKIIEHMTKIWEWWEFFPASLSPFGYNETVASEYFPLGKEEALKLWFNWSDYEAPFPKVEKIIPASKLPDDILKIPDDILNWAIECEVTGKPFRIIKQELEFYRKHNLPIPRRHPDQRHLDRMSLRNPRKLFERTCDKCHKDILTTYAPERTEIVYCENCYEKEVV